MGWPEPPLEPIRIIIKITRHSLRPRLRSISMRSPSLSSSGRSETSLGIACLALCLGEPVATATSPSGDILAVDICLLVRLSATVSPSLPSVCLLLLYLQERAPRQFNPNPRAHKFGGLYKLRLRNSLENRDTLASPGLPIKRKERRRGSSTNKKKKKLCPAFLLGFLWVLGSLKD